MKDSKRILVFLLVIIAANSLQANTDSLILELRTEVQQLRDSLVSYDAAQANQTLKNIQSYIDNPWDFIKLLGWTILLTVGLVSIFFFMLNRFNPKWYVKLIQRLVEKYEEVNVLKRKKRILILSPEAPPNKDFIDSFFTEREFNFDTLNTNTFQQPKKGFDILFANNENGGIDQELLEEYLSKNVGSCLFYFGASGTWNFKKYLKEDPYQILKRISFANSRAQVYGNLVSMLKFHDLVTPKIKQ